MHLSYFATFASIASYLVAAQAGAETSCIQLSGGPKRSDVERLRKFAKKRLIKDNFCPIGADTPGGNGNFYGPSYCVRCGTAEISIINAGDDASDRCFNNQAFDNALNEMLEMGDGVNRCDNAIEDDYYMQMTYGTPDAWSGECKGANLRCD